jgi:cell division protein FtsW (lipid II flippase)
MDRLREYAVQTAVAALQCAIIQVGTIVSTVLLRSAGYPDDSRNWPALPAWIREWGPLAFAVPAAWVIATILLERHRSEWFTKRWTLVSGLLVALLLVLTYLTASLQGWRLLPHAGT